jgi:hypothetical protein
VIDAQNARIWMLFYGAVRQANPLKTNAKLLRMQHYPGKHPAFLDRKCFASNEARF